MNKASIKKAELEKLNQLSLNPKLIPPYFMLYPSKHDPIGLRLSCKALKESKYFSIVKYKTLKRLLKEVNEESCRINERIKAKKIREDLDINKLFDRSGRLVNVLLIENTRRNGFRIVAYALKGKKRIALGEKTVRSKSNLESIDTIFDKKLKLEGITNNPEIKKLYKQAKSLFIEDALNKIKKNRREERVNLSKK